MMKMEYLLQTEVGSQGQEDTEVKVTIILMSGIHFDLLTSDS